MTEDQALLALLEVQAHDTRLDQLHHLQDTLRQAGWQLQRVDSERGETAYRVYALTPPVD